MLYPVLPHLLQRRKPDGPAHTTPPSADLLLDYCRTASFYSIKLYASSIENAPLARTHVFLALRRFAKASLALRNV